MNKAEVSRELFKGINDPSKNLSDVVYNIVDSRIKTNNRSWLIIVIIISLIFTGYAITNHPNSDKEIQQRTVNK